MKKMVCEVCGSQAFKKINGFFVCQECNVEYSSEDAKRLIQEVDAPSEVITKTDVADSNADKYKLMKCLSLYIDSILSLNLSKFWFDIDYVPSSEIFWNQIYNLESLSPIVPSSTLYFDGKENNYYSRFYIGELKDRTPYDIFKDSKLGLLVDLVERNWDSEWQHLDSIGLVSKHGYNVSVQTDDGKYNVLLHDLPNSKNKWVKYFKELCDTNKDYYLHKIVVKQGLFSLKNVDVKCSFTDLDVTKTIHETNRFLDALTSYDKAILDRYRKEFDKAKEEYIKLVNNIKELEKQFFVPYKYRDPSILYEMLNIITSGRADTWKELVNIFETDEYRNKTLVAFNVIKGGLDNINRTLVEGFTTVSENLKSIDNQLTTTNMFLMNINNKVSNIARGVDYIAFETFFDHF